jgi:hypothetical protein
MMAFISWNSLKDKKVVFLGEREVETALWRAGIISEMVENGKEKLKNGDATFLENTEVVLCFSEDCEEILWKLRMLEFRERNAVFLYFSPSKEDPLEEKVKKFQNIAHKVLIPFTLENLIEEISTASPPSDEEREEFIRQKFQEWARRKIHNLRLCDKKIYDILESSSNVEDFLNRLKNANIPENIIEEIKNVLR